MHINTVLLFFRIFALEPFIDGTGRRFKNVALAVYSLLFYSYAIIFIVIILMDFFEQTVLVFNVAFLCKSMVLLWSQYVIILQVCLY